MPHNNLNNIIVHDVPVLTICENGLQGPPITNVWFNYVTQCSNSMLIFSEFEITVKRLMISSDKIVLVQI